MSTLNSRLQLSILNRKKGKNLAEKGFTLIELLITVVILGTLSSIALPTFLNQQDKAKAAGVGSLAKNAASSCQVLQIDGEEGNYVALANVGSSYTTGNNGCPPIGTTATFTVSDTDGPGKGWATPATAVLGTDGSITLNKGSKQSQG